MSDRNTYLPHAANGEGAPPAIDLRERSILPPGLSFWGKVWFWTKFWLLVKTARLRFIAVLVAIGGVIAYWDTLQAYYEKWTRPNGVAAAAASDIEFWCPMHPTIITEKPDKCPICGMPLSKRKKGDKGEAETWPPGVVSRVQLTPYRVALAGIRTAEVGYRPLVKDITTVGTVEFDERRLARIAARVTGKSRIDKLYVNVTGQTVSKGDPLADLYSPDLVVTVQNLLDAQRSGNRDLLRGARDRLGLWGIEDDQINKILRTGKPITHLTIRSPISGHVIKKYQVEGEYVEEGARLYDIADLSTVWVEAQVYENELAFLKEGIEIRATTKAYPSREFRGMVSFIHPHLDSRTRTLKVRFDVVNELHELRPGMYASVKLQVSMARLDLFPAALADDWRDGVAVDSVAYALAGPPLGAGLAPLLQTGIRQAAMERGLVLAVPENAVIDTGSRKLVYREAEPNVYDGVEIQLGPRSGAYYSVVRGLEPGDRVATAGSFLIDAETRLTSGAGSIYFGASGGPQGERRSAATASAAAADDLDSKVKAALAKLSAADRPLAEAQKFCPVRDGSPLGSMGTPVKVILEGQPVFLCCKGCLADARKDAKKMLAKTAELKAQNKAGVPAPPTKLSAEEAEIKASLEKLSAADRRLAEAQSVCPIAGKRLGSMGAPVKVMLKGRPVFLCCDGCEDDAKANPDKTLGEVEKLKAGKGKVLPRK